MYEFSEKLIIAKDRFIVTKKYAINIDKIVFIELKGYSINIQFSDKINILNFVNIMDAENTFKKIISNLNNIDSQENNKNE